ncbi:hypothetical protein [Anaerospora hongkongensis]|uniref:hypothetical protein n=1 Tax=Anaerospora hongkongensis TaxID=244830 RepID=UPI002FDA9511
MSYDPSFPADDGILADFPPGYREQIRALVEDAVVNALKIQGLTPGNTSGSIPISNGTKNQNLNADMLDGKDSTDFAAATHTHAAATTSTSGFLTGPDLLKLNGIAAGAEVNQMAFSNVLVGSTTIQADAKTDTFEMVAGTNIALTPDATNDRVTIGVTGTVAAATTAGTCTGNAATATNATNHIAAASGAHTATAISCTATGDVSATTVQAAIAELAAEKTPLNHASTGTTYGISSAADYGHAKATSASPLMNGTSAVGTDNGLYARGDHIHPTDSTRAPLASPALTGTPTAPTAAPGTNTTQIATMAAVQAATSNLVGTRLWISEEFFVSAIGTPVVLTHGISGLDVTRAQVQVLGKCVVAGNGYSVGDIIVNPAIGADAQFSGPVQPLLTATSVTIWTSSYNSIYLRVKTTGASVAASLATNWKLIVQIFY